MSSWHVVKNAGAYITLPRAVVSRNSPIKPKCSFRWMSFTSKRYSDISILVAPNETTVGHMRRSHAG